MSNSKLFSIAFLCLLPISGRAAIANLGSCAAGTTGTPVNNCTLSSTATGAVNIFFAYRSGSATAPTLPTACNGTTTITACYQNIGTFPAAPTSTTGVARLYCRVATSGSDTGSGTATNATAVAGLSYSGSDVPSNLSSACAGLGVGVGAGSNSTSTATATFASLIGADGTVAHAFLGSNNWIGAFLGTSGGTVCAPASILASRASTTAISALDSNGTAASYTAQTCTSTTNWITVAFVIKAPAVASANGPVMKRRWAYSGAANELGGGTATVFLTNLDASGTPRAAVSGDLLVIAMKYPTGNAPTISDSTGGTNTWSSIITNNDTQSSTEAVSYSCLAATTTSYTLTYGTATANTQWTAYLINGASCGGSPLDGTAVCANVSAATSNLGSRIQPGTITTSASNSMVMQFIWAASSGNSGMANQAMASAWGDNYTGLFQDTIYGGYASQYAIIPASSTVINPGFTFVQSTHDATATCVVAFKSGASGAAAGVGVSIPWSQAMYVNTGTGPPNDWIYWWQFAGGSETAIILTSDIQTAIPFTGGISDSGANTWTHVADTFAPTLDPEIFFACNATLSNNYAVNISKGTGLGSNDVLLQFYGVTGLVATNSTACLDTNATAANTSSLTATNSGASVNTQTFGTPCTFASPCVAADLPSLTPGAGNTDIFIAVGVMGTGPMIGNTTMTFAWPYGDGLGDANSLTNGDGAAYLMKSTTTVNSTWKSTSASAPATVVMAAFKAIPSSAALCTITLLGAGPC